MALLRILPIFAITLSSSISTIPPHAAESPAEHQTDLRQYAADTWKSFEAMTGPIGLPTDGLRRAANGTWSPAGYTSPTDIGAYLWSVVAVEDLGLINTREAEIRLDRALTGLAGLERAHGFFYNWYDPATGARLSMRPGDGAPVRPFLSSVDNGWLAVALLLVGNAHPALRERTDALLGPMDFGFFYNPYDSANPIEHPGLLRIGYWTDTNSFTPAHYGLLNTEPRIASYLGMARGQVPLDHYYRMLRVLPVGSMLQQQTPSGTVRTYHDISVFEGHYTVGNFRIVPSWGGSMFEALMVPLFVPEDRWAPGSWGVNHPLYVRIQEQYGQAHSGGLWGFSPSCRPSGGYGEYGVPELGSRPGGYGAADPNSEPGPAHAPTGVVTPHASFLALRFAPERTLANLKALATQFPIYGAFGFYDSVDVGTGRVSEQVLALDQGMILAAIANDLSDDVLQRTFCRGAVEEVIQPLIAQELFTAGADPVPTSPSTEPPPSSAPATSLAEPSRSRGELPSVLFTAEVQVGE